MHTCDTSVESYLLNNSNKTYLQQQSLGLGTERLFLIVQKLQSGFYQQGEVMRLLTIMPVLTDSVSQDLTKLIIF